MVQINTNTYSLMAGRHLAQSQLGLNAAMERLTSSLRVNSARDDASGLQQGMLLESQIREIGVELRQQGDVISRNQIGDAALASVSSIVQRIMEINQSGGGSVEIDLLVEQAKAVMADAGERGGVVGDTGLTSTTITVTATPDTATLDAIADARATAGATMNNAQFSIEAKLAGRDALSAKRGRIMDADYAAESANLARFEIMQHAGLVMLGKANELQASVLRLLG